MLSDEAAVDTGSLGMLPSAAPSAAQSISYEPGCTAPAPDIMPAGAKANPLGAILTARHGPAPLR